jgi:hypothetical protein
MSRNGSNAALSDNIIQLQAYVVDDDHYSSSSTEAIEKIRLDVK